MKHLYQEVSELVNHIRNMLDDDIFDKTETHMECLLNGTVVRTFKKCPCTNFADEVFHDMFRKIDWTESNLKYLN